VYKIIISYWNFVTCIFLIFYYFENKALLSIPLSMACFLYFLIKPHSTVQSWAVLVVYISILIIVKFLIQIPTIIPLPTDLETILKDSNVAY